jgi:hypothetical protein
MRFRCRCKGPCIIAKCDQMIGKNYKDTDPSADNVEVTSRSFSELIRPPSEPSNILYIAVRSDSPEFDACRIHYQCEPCPQCDLHAASVGDDLLLRSAAGCGVCNELEKIYVSPLTPTLRARIVGRRIHTQDAPMYSRIPATISNS